MPDLVIINATVRTLDTQRPLAEAVAVSGNRIAVVGTSAEIIALTGSRTRIFDARGQLVLPGFNDAHVHFLSGGFQLSSVDVRDAATPQELAERIRKFAATLPPGRWMTGGDWDHERWPTNSLPTRELIDAATPATPVFVSRLDGHMALANSLAFPRFAGAKVVASMQPYHCADDGRWAEKRIGSERTKGTYAFRSLLDAGATLAFGSDWTVAPLDPLTGIAAAVTRRTLDGKHPGGWVPEQKITVKETVRAYTVGSAYAEFADPAKGTLVRGKLADLVVLDKDIFKIPPAEIETARVQLTIVEGRVVYEAGRQPGRD